MLLTACLFGSFSSLGAGRVKELMLILRNPLPSQRTDEVVSLKRTFFKTTTSLYPVFKKSKKLLICQYVDGNKDEQWDEVLFQITLAPRTTDTVQVEWVEKSRLPKFEHFTGVRLSLRSTDGRPTPNIEKAVRARGFTQNIAAPYYQMEGPGIENDKVAFRAFFDNRNGKDIYGKVKAEPVLESVGVTGSWHQLQEWGMDILKVGSSLGAGALAVKEKEKLYRLADADSSFFELLYGGPLQAAFVLTFKGWDIGSVKGDGMEIITINKGEYFYRNKITIPLKSNQQLVSGLANFSGADAKLTKYNAAFSSISTYGAQADGTKTALGLAVLFSASQHQSHGTTAATDPIGNTSYVALKSLPAERTLFVFACWEKTDIRFITKEGFASYLQQIADKLANPIHITIKK